MMMRKKKAKTKSASPRDPHDWIVEEYEKRGEVVTPEELREVYDRLASMFDLLKLWDQSAATKKPPASLVLIRMLGRKGLLAELDRVRRYFAAHAEELLTEVRRERARRREEVVGHA